MKIPPKTPEICSKAFPSTHVDSPAAIEIKTNGSPTTIADK